jgi:hypothetical protein
VVTAVVSAFVLLASSTAFAASNHRWTGGHDAPGWATPARALYFAEGTTRNGFEEYLVLRNPSRARSSVRIQYSFPDEPSVGSSFIMEPLSGSCVNVNDAVGRGKDVSVAITSDDGIVAERQVYFNYMGVWTGGHVSCGVPAPGNTWYFAEGTTRPGFQEWLCLQNPGASDVGAVITYMLGSGENVSERVVVPAKGRRTVDVNAALSPGLDVSVMVRSDGPVVAERPMYFDYEGAWRGGHTAAGTSAPDREWLFAEGTTRPGFEEWLCIMNPGPGAVAKVEYMFEGEPSIVRTYPLKERARTTIPVNEEVGPGRDVSLRVTASSGVLCERPMYFLYRGAIEGGHDLAGSGRGEKTWYFPAAGTGDGFEAYLCLMNGGRDSNRVRVEFMGTDGAKRKTVIEMPARSRETIDVNAAVSGLMDPWIKVTGDRELVAERPVYFSYVPKVELGPFAFASWAGMELASPIRYCDYLGAVFHEAGRDGGDGRPNNPQAMQPLGRCLEDDNPLRLAPGVSKDLGGEAAYFIEDSRARGTFSTTACDVMAKTGTTVYAPVSGTVVAAESYLLYGRYPDLRVRIQIDGHPGYLMAVLHMSRLLVSRGQRVEAGVTPVGLVRDLVPYFNSGPDPYTREEGNHSHIEIDYRPDLGIGAGDTAETEVETPR